MVGSVSLRVGLARPRPEGASARRRDATRNRAPGRVDEGQEPGMIHVPWPTTFTIICSFDPSNEKWGVRSASSHPAPKWAEEWVDSSSHHDASPCRHRAHGGDDGSRGSSPPSLLGNHPATRWAVPPDAFRNSSCHPASDVTSVPCSRYDTQGQWVGRSPGGGSCRAIHPGDEGLTMEILFLYGRTSVPGGV
jgi:hypothetical protein